MLQWYFWVGLIAAVCISIFTMPQLIQVIRTKHTEGLSIMMLCLLTFGDFCFALNGIGVLVDTAHIPELGSRLSGGLPLFLANVIATTISAILLWIKFSRRRWAKKFGVTEKEFCDNYETFKAKIKMQKIEKKTKKITSDSEPKNKVLGA